jgi:hypothetical protein
MRGHPSTQSTRSTEGGIIKVLVFHGKTADPCNMLSKLIYPSFIDQRILRTMKRRIWKLIRDK